MSDAAQALSTSFMTPVPNKHGVDILLFGKVVGNDNLLAVVVKNGGGMFFCKKHERVFHPTAQCPECAGNPIPEPATA